MELSPFTAMDAGSLRWLRRGQGPLEFDLLAADRPVATLNWKDTSRSTSLGRTAGGSWTLKSAGFLNPHITIRTEGGAADVARLSVHLSHHQIDFSRGRSYRFHRAGVLLPAWQVTGPDGAEVLHIEPVREGRTLVGGAVIAPAAATNLSDLPVLLLATWFFIVLAWFEDEALVPLEGPEAP